MSNEELVKEIQNGNTGAKNELWKRIWKLVYTFCKPYQAYAAKMYLEMDDLMNAAWFGVERAIKAYNPDKGYRFNTYLQYHVINAIRELLGLRGHKELSCVSLDEPLDSEEEFTRLDTLEDESASKGFEAAEDKQIAFWLWNRVERLPHQEREVILAYYRDDIKLAKLATQKGCSKQVITQLKNTGLRLLRKDQELKRYYREISYQHVTLSAFKRTWTSSTELAVLKLNQERSERKVFPLLDCSSTVQRRKEEPEKT